MNGFKKVFAGLFFARTSSKLSASPNFPIACDLAGMSSYLELVLIGTMILAIVRVLFSDLLPSVFGGYADQRFLLCLIFGVLAPTCAFFFLWRRTVSLTGASWALKPALILSLAFLSFPLPFMNLPYLWVEPGMYALFFGVPLALGGVLSWTGGINGYTRFLVLISAAFCAFYGLSTINVYLFAIFDGVTKLTNFVPEGFVNIRYWSHVATWLLPLMPLAVLWGPEKNQRLWRVLVAVGSGLWWWIIFLSSARGSALGLVFGVILVGFLFGRRIAPWLKLLFLHVGLGAVFWLLLSVAIPTLLADEMQLRSLSTDSSGRWPLWVEAWKMSLQNFPFGMGPQSWLTHAPITEAYANGKKFGHPHNMYLMWAAEYGWLFILMVAIVVALAIRRFWKRRTELMARNDSRQLLLLAGFTASVSAALFHAGVSAVFMAPGSMLVGLFVLIGFWALIQPTATSQNLRPVPERQSRFRFFAAMALVAALISLWALWAREVWHYYQDMRADERHYQEHVREGTQPRFWLHGNFPRDE